MCIRSRQHIRTDCKRLRPFGILPEGDTGNPEDTGLLLDPAGIGEHETGIRFELEEFEEACRLHDPDALMKDPEAGEHLLRPRVHGEDDRETILFLDRL